MPISYILPDVLSQLAKWNIVRDCLSGQEAIKAKGDVYLPRPNADDTSNENKARYTSYLQRAVFYNVTKRTLDGLVGQVFSREPIVTVPPLVGAILDNIDGAGVSLDQQAKKTLSAVMSFGRCGLLVDYPETNGVVTLEQLQKGFIRPTICYYDPWEINNWRTITVGAKELLSLVVLQEQYIAADDGFETETKSQYRVLRLKYTADVKNIIDPDSLEYHVEIWREDTTTAEAQTPYQSYMPVDSQGKPFKEIPFTFVGALNNDPSIDQPPLYDMAALNIAHYRNSADYEESCFTTGQPTPYFAGLTEHWVNEVWKGSVRMGARSAIPLPEGGTAGLLQPNPNTLPFEAMGAKEHQMVALGAKLVEQRRIQRTLGETQIQETSESSILSTVTHNVNNAYEKALYWMTRFTGPVTDPENVEYELNTDFPASRMSPEERAQLMAEWQSGAISYSEYRLQLRRAGVASLEDKDALEEVKKNPPPQASTASGNGGDANGRMSPSQDGKTQ